MAGWRAGLRQEGYLPLLIRPRWLGINFGWHRRSIDWVYFTRHLATVLGAGIPLTQGLTILAAHAATRTKREHWQLVREQVDGGCPLSETIQEAPLFVRSMVQAGEKTRAYASVLAEVADELEYDRRFRNRMKTALAYPSLLSGTFVLVFWVLAVWVLPMYKQLFDGLEVDLPYLTRAIFAVGQRLPWGVGILAVAGVVVFGVEAVRHPEDWRADLYGLGVRVPIVGPVYRLGEIVQFIRILGRLLRAGIPLMESLRQAGGTVRSRTMRRMVEALVDSVYQGKRLAPVLRRFGLFPADACEMLAVAEDTGQLEGMLGHLERIFRQDLEKRMEQLLQMIEPVMIAGLACVIGLTAVGFLLPVFDASTHLQ